MSFGVHKTNPVTDPPWESVVSDVGQYVKAVELNELGARYGV